jgi:hypothetical protein
MLRIGSETRFAGLELSAEKRHWKLVAIATGTFQTVCCVHLVQLKPNIAKRKQQG